MNTRQSGLHLVQDMRRDVVRPQDPSGYLTEGVGVPSVEPHPGPAAPEGRVSLAPAVCGLWGVGEELGVYAVYEE